MTIMRFRIPPVTMFSQLTAIEVSNISTVSGTSPVVLSDEILMLALTDYRLFSQSVNG